jgi:hypothetical protein
MTDSSHIEVFQYKRLFWLMMLSQLRISIAATVIGMCAGLTQAYSQTSELTWNREPSQQEINLHQEMTIRAAREAVQDDAAKVEITFFSLRMGFDNYAHACGYVTPSDGRPKQRFTYPFSGKARLFGSLKDDVFIHEMATCNFLPRSPWSAPDESFWADLYLFFK